MHTHEIIISKSIEIGFEQILTLQHKNEHCGLIEKKYSVKQNFGVGEVIILEFKGIFIKHIQINLDKNIRFRGKQTTDALIFSSLFNGVKEINVPKESIHLIQEKNEGYISFVKEVHGSVEYAKNQLINEVVIKLSHEFIKKHQLDLLLPITDKFSIHEFKNNYIQYLDLSAIEIINNIVSNDKKGLLKRLYLESKILELLSTKLLNRTQNSVKSNTILKKTHEVKELINKNLNTQFSIKDLSKKVFMNETILKKEFKKIFGCTVFEYAVSERMKASKKLLMYTDKPIYEIADLVGYKNATHFSAAFKKHENTTPKQFRKQHS